MTRRAHRFCPWQKTATERLTGMGPGRMRATAAAAVVGAANAVATYRLLRSVAESEFEFHREREEETCQLH